MPGNAPGDLLEIVGFGHVGGEPLAPQGAVFVPGGLKSLGATRSWRLPRLVARPRRSAPRRRGAVRRPGLLSSSHASALPPPSKVTSTSCSSSCRVRHTPLRYEGRAEPGPMGRSALGTSSTWVETRRRLRVLLLGEGG